MEIRLVVWNVAWRRTSSRRGKTIRERIERENPDIVVLTEGYPATLGLHEAASDAEYGYGVSDRRKVLIYSRAPWRQVETLDASVEPSGRLVAGVTSICGIDIMCMGVCVPWKMAHVSTGRRDRTHWQDHRQYLHTFGRYFSAKPRGPTIVAGDFNQHIPRIRQPMDVSTELLGALPAPMSCVTTSDSSGIDGLIDHVFVSQDFRPLEVRGLSNMGNDGDKLSDHVGLSLKLELRLP